MRIRDQERTTRKTLATHVGSLHRVAPFATYFAIASLSDMGFR